MFCLPSAKENCPDQKIAAMEFEVSEKALDEVNAKSRSGRRNVVECTPLHLAFVILGFCIITTAVALMVYYIPDRSPLEGTKIPGDGTKPPQPSYTTVTLPQTTDQILTTKEERQTTAPTEDPLMVGRLPRTVLPRRYLLNVRPYLYDDDVPYSKLNRSRTFDGWVNIKVECMEPTAEIVLHSYTLIVHGTPSVMGLDTAEPRELLDRFSFDEENMFLVLKLKESLEPRKNYEIKITFSGSLNMKLFGFYVSEYTTSGGEKR